MLTGLCSVSCAQVTAAWHLFPVWLAVVGGHVWKRGAAQKVTSPCLSKPPCPIVLQALLAAVALKHLLS